MKNGKLIIQTKKDIMELLHNFQNILKKDKHLNLSQHIKKFGGKYLFIFKA